MPAERMHAATRRSRESLRAAILDLAARSSIRELTVSEICVAAGVTRDTFYRHADSPVTLLADALGAELEQLADGFDVGDPAMPAVAGTVETAILEHVIARLAVYRGAMTPVLPAAIRARLETLFAAGLAVRARTSPEILPERLSSDRAVAIAVAYAASGAVGAIETWLSETADRQGDAVGEAEIADTVEIILAASPPWWRAGL